MQACPGLHGQARGWPHAAGGGPLLQQPHIVRPQPQGNAVCRQTFALATFRKLNLTRAGHLQHEIDEAF